MSSATRRKAARAIAENVAKGTAAQDPAATPASADGHGSQHWDCGNGHYAAERVLRIVERAPGNLWSCDLLQWLADAAYEAGPAHCKAALERMDDDAIPF